MLDTIDLNLHRHVHTQNRFAVIPTAEKLNAEPEFTGRGVTIAFLDSGFYPHPDFASRVRAFYDISGEEKFFDAGLNVKSHHWHGTQTVVACAGNGALSAGIYRGIASEAELVLVKVSQNGSISDESIEKGLRWIIENREKYNIRILNLSLGGDIDLKTEESGINRLAEELIRLGVVVTVAAGNSDRSHSIPPANAPSVITVGGYSDENKSSTADFTLYHSNFGETADGLVKPEIIAPAMFVAAPILPETEDYKIAEALSLMASMPDYSFQHILRENWHDAGLSADILNCDIDSARKIIEYQLYARKIVATHYKHVDGTSFAAPITASVVAQMLQINPDLTPAIVKNILISTASRLPGFSAVRQGFGVLNAARAIEAAGQEMHFFNQGELSAPGIENGKLIFRYHDDTAKSVHLAGDFNDWKTGEIAFSRSENGLWQAEVSLPPAGEYAYKFVINNQIWREDPSHGRLEDDGVGGFNSILFIE